MGRCARSGRPAGAVGIVHAESPHRSWPEATRLLERGREFDVALFGFPLPEHRLRSYRSRPVEGLRALVHGHEPVERGANRWNLGVLAADSLRVLLGTGAGIRRLQRLSLLEASAPELRSWTFDVDEG